MEIHSAILYSSDIERARTFYIELLGLQLDYQAEDKFLSLKMDGGTTKIGIKKQVEERELPGHQTFSVIVEDIQTFYDRLKQSELQFQKELTQESWALEFSIFDPDMNKIIFRDR